MLRYAKCCDMMYILVVLSSLLIFDSICEDGDVINQGYRRLYEFDNKVLLGDVHENHSSVRSRTRCASLCFNSEQCVSFFHNSDSQMCRLVTIKYSTLSGLEDTEESSKYYTLPPGPCCRYTPPVSPTGIPRIAIATGSNMSVYDRNGTLYWSVSSMVRAMFYHPFKDRLYLGTDPVTSRHIDGSDPQTHGSDYTGTLMGFENNPYDDSMYLSISNYHVDILAADDTVSVLANITDVYKPRQNRMDTVEKVLYWADEALKTVKYRKVDGTGSVVTVFTHTEIVWGLDIDFDERKIYWCAKSTGKVFVYDMDSSTQTLLVPNTSSLTGSCSGLRLYDNHIYLIYYRLDHMEKRAKDGTLVSNILDGQIEAAKTKYFAIVE